MATTLPFSNNKNLLSSESMTSALTQPGVWDDDNGYNSAQLFFVSTYSDFDRLAHGPRGHPAKYPLHVYRFQPSDGSLILLNVLGDAQKVINPAFSRYHHRLNVVYTCTEDIENNGQVFAYSVGPDGVVEQLGEPVDAGGTSTCYLTIDKAGKHLLCVNYWDSTLSSIPISEETGELLGPIRHMYDPKCGQKVLAAGRVHGGVNHSFNDSDTIKMRQKDPHSHALVLDSYFGVVAYVPDLGKDLIREFYYDSQAGKIDMEFNVLPSGLCTGMPDGPRYFEFHPKYNIAYCINELSSTVAVFEVDRVLLQEIAAVSARKGDMSRFRGRSTLRLVQSIKTIPSAFPTTMNTCGRICVHKSGRFVLVSNRGHESIAVFSVRTKGPKRGELGSVGFFHTRGETPRHFQFDASGQYLLVANQDSDSIAVFNFNLSNGEIKYTGNKYRVPSPNFICCCQTNRDDDDSAVFTSSTASLNSEKMDNVLVHTAKSACPPDTDELSDSELSATHPTTSVDTEKESLLAELARARHEISELRKQLGSVSEC